MPKPFKRSFTIMFILVILLIFFSSVYVYSRFNDVSMLENLTFYGGFVLCLVLIFFLIRLCILSKSFHFWRKTFFRITSFVVTFFVIFIFFTAVDRTMGVTSIIPNLAKSGDEYSFTITDRETSYYRINVPSPYNSNLLPQKIIVPTEMVDHYEEDTQYIVSYFYIDLGSLGFYYKVNQVN